MLKKLIASNSEYSPPMMQSTIVRRVHKLLMDSFRFNFELIKNFPADYHSHR